MIKEFKDFISQGNVIDLAVGLVMGSAFTAIVNSVVSDLIMPIVELLAGNGIEEIAFTVGAATFKIGMFFQAIINFLIISLVLFLVLKAVNKMRKPVEVVEETPVVSEEVQLLREIRDSLNK